MELKSMKMTAEQAKEYAIGVATAPDADAPRYPYGLCIRIDDDGIDALGLMSLPTVGQTVMIMARATVKLVEQRQMLDGETERCLEIQITDMALSPESSSKPPEQTLYSAG